MFAWTTIAITILLSFVLGAVASGARLISDWVGLLVPFGSGIALIGDTYLIGARGKGNRRSSPPSNR